MAGNGSSATGPGVRRRRRLVLLVAGVVVALAAGVAPAHAIVVKDKLAHKWFGVELRPGAVAPGRLVPRAAKCLEDDSDCSAVTYNGGPVMHSEAFYLVFWTPAGHAVPSTYKYGLANWLKEEAARNYTAGQMFSLDQQYYDTSGPGGAKRFVPYALSDAGTLVDTTPYPASGCTDPGTTVCLTDAQLTSELQSYISAHSLPRGLGVGYFIFTPANVGSCFDSTSTVCAYASNGYCAYHSDVGSGASDVLYAVMPWSFDNACDNNTAFAAGYPNADGIDSVVDSWSHEASEMMTDPDGNAWYQVGGTDDGYEISDKCAYIYGNGGVESLAGLANNGMGYYNYTLGSDQYLLQFEWDQRVLNCKRTDSDTQPVVSISPTTASHGASTAFTANVTDPAGISTVSWSFGDGSASVVTTTASTNHTYASAGTYTMTVIVTDGHGNEKKVVQTISVS